MIYDWARYLHGVGMRICSLSAIFLVLTFSLFGQRANLPGSTPYSARDFSYLLGKMPGFEDSLLQTHFTLYQGYVKNANLLLETLKGYLASGQERDYPFQAIKRRLGWELDGMRLHELYFENLGGKGAISSDSSLYQMIERDFGSYAFWKKEFLATGMMRGVGWSILYFDPVGKRLINLWINEHDVSHLAGGVPLLVMDVWEHAYMPQYGLNRQGYVDTFFQNINWAIVEERFPK